MNLTSVTQVQGLLKELGVRPSRARGQNFLIDANILRILLDMAEAGSDDHVLEIGPGLGVLTRGLLERGSRVTGVERDRVLSDFLVRELGDEPRFCLVAGDVLDMDLTALLQGGDGVPVTKVVSNLPYSAGTRILMSLVTTLPVPAHMVVTLQREVAERLAARPGTAAYGLSSVWTQLVYDVEKVKDISPGCFWPRPEVQSAAVTLVRHDRFALGAEQRSRLYGLTRHAFRHRRKQLAGILGRYPRLGLNADYCRGLLREMGLDAGARPENLAVEHWIRMASDG